MSDEDFYEIRDRWASFCERLSAIKYFGEHFVGSVPLRADSDKLCVGLHPDKANELARLQKEKNITKLENCLRDTFRRAIDVELVLQSAEEVAVQEEEASVAASAPAAAETEAPADPAKVENLPVVRKILDTFNGEVLSVSERPKNDPEE